MKLIIAGSRTIGWDLALKRIVEYCRNESSPYYDELFEVDEIVSGCAKGVDEAGEDYADFYDIKLKRFPANWVAYGKAAGPKRNRQMAEYADALLLIWDGHSRGSLNMKKQMKELGKPVYEVMV